MGPEVGGSPWAICGTEASVLAGTAHHEFTNHHNGRKMSVDLSLPELLQKLRGELGCG